MNFSKNVFSQLNIYENLTLNYFNDDPILRPNFSEPNMGLINDPDYCEMVDNYNYKNPSNILRRVNFITDYNPDGLPRKDVMSKVGRVVVPEEVSKDMNRTESRKVG